MQPRYVKVSMGNSRPQRCGTEKVIIEQLDNDEEVREVKEKKIQWQERDVIIQV